MSSKKKKQAIGNAFFFFMSETKRQYERRGENVAGGLKSFAIICDPLWKALDASYSSKTQREPYISLSIMQTMKMSKAEREPFEVMAKEARSKRFMECEDDKLTSVGVSSARLNYDCQMAELELSSQKDAIKNTVSRLRGLNALRDQSFFLIHVNYYLHTGKTYIPAEIALSEFSLGEGVKATFHSFIWPGPFPLGTTGQAKDHSDKTHRIPTYEWSEGQKDYAKLFNDIKRFLKVDSSSMPPSLYTMNDDYNNNTSMSAVNDALAGLCDAVNMGDASPFQVFNLTDLFYHLRLASWMEAKTDDECPFKNSGMAEFELTKDVFNFTANIACKFHSDEDNVSYCSLSVVQRWAFLICDHCCQDLGIRLIPGQHCPSNADVSPWMLGERKRPDSVPPKAQMRPTFVDHSLRSAKPAFGWTSARSAPKTGSSYGSVCGSAYESDHGSTHNDDNVSVHSSQTDKSYSKLLQSETAPNMTEFNFPQLAGRGSGIARESATMPSRSAGRGLARNFANMSLSRCGEKNAEK